MLIVTSGVLYLPNSKTLIVSDLHLEKGAAFARRGLLHPPYDTSQTLDKLHQCIDYFAPQTVISLGDSFHDQLGSEFLPEKARSQLKQMQTGRDWIWISGNHDPEPHKSIEGDCMAISRNALPAHRVSGCAKVDRSTRCRSLF